MSNLVTSSSGNLPLRRGTLDLVRINLCYMYMYSAYLAQLVVCSTGWCSPEASIWWSVLCCVALTLWGRVFHDNSFREMLRKTKQAIILTPVHNSYICCVEGVLFEATEVATEQDPLPSSHEVCHNMQCAHVVYNVHTLILLVVIISPSQSIEKKVASILPVFRVSTHAHPTIGYHCATQDGVYEILFDNSYSR